MVFTQEHILGFQVPVHHARTVRCRDAIEGRAEQLPTGRQGQRGALPPTSFQQGTQGAAGHELQNQEGQAFPEPFIEDLNHVGVLHGCQHPRLALEAAAQGFVLCHLRAHELQRHHPPEPGVTGPPDIAKGS